MYGRGVVEREAGRLAKLRGEVFELALELAMCRQDGLLGRLQHAIDPPQHGERQDHVGILAPLEGISQQIRNSPDKGDLLTEVVHHESLYASDCRATLFNWSCSLECDRTCLDKMSSVSKSPYFTILGGVCKTWSAITLALLQSYIAGRFGDRLKLVVDVLQQLC